MDLKDNYYTLVIDFDTPLYQKIIGLQKNYIEVEYQNNGRKKVFDKKTDFQGTKKTSLGGWLGEKNKKRKDKGLSPFLLKDFNIEHKSKVVSSDIVAIKSLSEYVKHLQELNWVKDIKILIGGRDNFRYKIYPAYKEGREKPLRFFHVKNKFCEKYKDFIIFSDGCESDDKLSEYGWWAWNNKKDNVMLGHIDKDCDTIPGKHWNFHKNKFYEVSEFQAHFNLCVQCIIGDKGTDNIPGVPKINDCIQDRYPIGLGGVGPVKAKLMLKGCDTIPGLYREVEEIYKCYYREDYKEPLNLTYKLVHLLEKRGEVKDFPFTK